ncbi:hypothetical protein HMPREF1585_01049, partial [Gardnerella vaginalis JCP8481B]
PSFTHFWGYKPEILIISGLVKETTNQKHNQKHKPHDSALPSSIETKADLACVESTLCFQLEQARHF